MHIFIYLLHKITLRGKNMLQFSSPAMIDILDFLEKTSNDSYNFVAPEIL